MGERLEGPRIAPQVDEEELGWGAANVAMLAYLGCLPRLAGERVYPHRTANHDVMRSNAGETSSSSEADERRR